MKKFICILLSALMILSVVSLASCDKKDENKGEEKADTLKFGFGLYTVASKASDADADVMGEGKVAITAAAVTIDADGKVVSCTLDTVDNTVKYTSDGKAIANDSFKSKYEAGKDYNMVAYGGAAKEWFEQADAFEKVVCGKNIDEIKGLVVGETNKGTDEVINAGCTIMVNEFVMAITNAYANAKDSDVTADDTLKLGSHTEQTCSDATDEKDGQNKLETTFFAAAVDADGKMVATASDCVQVVFTFNASGASTFDLTKAITSKREAGDNYGMKAYGGAAYEWYEQADAFNAACIGKTVKEIEGFMGDDNYGTDDIKKAGCTILVNGFVKAASKLG